MSRDRDSIRRREVLRVLAYLSLSGGWRLGSAASAQDLSDEELIKRLISEGDGGNIPEMPPRPVRESVLQSYTRDEWEAFREAKAKGSLWWRLSQNAQPKVLWPEDAHSIDFAHLAEFSPTKREFRLSAAVLKMLCERNNFVIPASQERLLFGLRGCALKNGGEETAWDRHHDLTWTRPNHQDFLCTLGVWNRTTDEIRVFRGSTVPEVSHMYLCALRISPTNLLPTGLYSYVVGTHNGSAMAQVGAFRLKGAVAALRTFDDLTYNASSTLEMWDDGELHDNIHAAFPTERTAAPWFSSAGCQVIKGFYHNGVPAGPWARFREAAGLTALTKKKNEWISAEEGNAYSYLLLTGQEASLAALQDKTFVKSYRRLRFGSTGAEVTALQKRLGVAESGRFDIATSVALVKQQRKNLQLESAIAEVVAGG